MDVRAIEESVCECVDTVGVCRGVCVCKCMDAGVCRGEVCLSVRKCRRSQDPHVPEGVR